MTSLDLIKLSIILIYKKIMMDKLIQTVYFKQWIRI